MGGVTVTWLRHLVALMVANPEAEALPGVARLDERQRTTIAWALAGWFPAS